MNFRISIFIFILLHDILRKNEGDIIMNELESEVKKLIISRYGTVKKYPARRGKCAGHSG